MHVICKITDTGVTAIQEDRSIYREILNKAEKLAFLKA